MATQQTVVAPRARADADEAFFKAEHTAAYLFVALAALLTAIGLLVGFGVLGDTSAAQTVADERGNEWLGLWDGAVWLLPAIAAAILSMALHRTEHHRRRDADTLPDGDEAAWKSEHTFAYVATAVSVICGLLCLLVGFGLIGETDQPDGILWGIASVVTAILATTLHGVGHHQLAQRRDVVVERRAATDIPR
jgi:DNA-directed RNA polymerase subunit beta